MATSLYHNTVFVLNFLSDMQPSSILDVGAGFGRWGFLCRCHLCGGNSVTHVPVQSVKIDAVEGYAGNVNPVYQAVYDNTHVGDARAVVPVLGQYDVIICGDMIEHLPKEDGIILVDEMITHAKTAVVLSVPLGACPQGSLGGNELEQHLATWYEADFARWNALVRPFCAGKDGVVGVAIIPCNSDSNWWVRRMRSRTRRIGSALLAWCKTTIRKG